MPPTPHGPLVDFGRFITKHASVMFTVVASAGLFLSLAVGGYANYWARRPKARDDVRFKTSFGFIGGSATPLDRSPAGSVVTTTLAHAGAGHGSGGGGGGGGGHPSVAVQITKKRVRFRSVNEVVSVSPAPTVVMDSGQETSDSGVSDSSAGSGAHSPPPSPPVSYAARRGVDDTFVPFPAAGASGRISNTGSRGNSGGREPADDSDDSSQ